MEQTDRRSPKRLGWAVAALALITLSPTSAASAAPLSALPDTGQVTLRLGPAFQAHSDLLASPFAQGGSGFTGALGYRGSALGVELAFGTASTTARGAATGARLGTEDVWTLDLEARWTRPTGRLGPVDVSLGAGTAGLASVRRHNYEGGGEEYFADLAVPLLAAVDLTRVRSPRTQLRESVGVSVATLLFRSPYAGTKSFPAGSLSGPWETTVVRHRLTLTHQAARRLVVGVSHGASFVSSDRSRPVRVLRQELTALMSLVLGGAP